MALFDRKKKQRLPNRVTEFHSSIYILELYIVWYFYMMKYCCSKYSKDMALNKI